MGTRENIWVCCGDNEIDEVRKYIEEESVDVNAKDDHGYTPIHAAISYGNAELARYLISKGAHINAVDNDGDTPLHYADEPSAAALALELGANIQAKNNDGLTPYEIPLTEVDMDMISFYRNLNVYPDELLNTIPDVHADGQTPDGDVDLDEDEDEDDVDDVEHEEEG